MLIGIQDEIMRLSQLGLLEPLLKDQTTGKNIRWATDAYTELGRAYAKTAEITPDLIIGEHSGVIRNRARKDLELQSDRTKSHAEVFTPIWVCNRMIDSALAESDPIHTTPCNAPDHSKATAPAGDEVAPKRSRKKRKDDFIQTRWLEITCGEAPFLVQRYDVLTGEIIPIEQRKGILDRKLQYMSSLKQTDGSDLEWTNWRKLAIRAFQSVYGYELQGDNLLIARLNLYMTFEEYLEYLYHRKPTRKESLKMVEIITWNLWQMDGLTHMTPCSEDPASPQRSLFDFMGISDKPKETPKSCQIRFHINARKILSFTLTQLAEQGDQAMKFDYIIGNPPYQEDVQNQGDRSNPIYDKFMDGAFKLSNIVELIHPARFLFNVGQTSKAWNKKMLNDEHYKIIHYEADSSKIFNTGDIKGGIAISIRNSRKKFGKIGVFVKHSLLNSISEKISILELNKNRLDFIISSRGLYHFTNQLFNEYPEIKHRLGQGTGSMIASNAFEKLHDIFRDVPTHADDLKFLGLYQKKRCYKYIIKDYIVDNKYIHKWNLAFPKSNGSGEFGEVLTHAEIIPPNVCATDTFINIGLFNSNIEAKNLNIYLKTKFLRALLYIKKNTQDNPKTVWNLIPLQDFTASSDIDWTKSIPEIDQQLYKKYGLDKDEIEFIETHVKAMT